MQSKQLKEFCEKVVITGKISVKHYNKINVVFDKDKVSQTL